MKGAIADEEHYGRMVAVNQLTEPLRREECLCLNCGGLGDGGCQFSKQLFEVCREGAIALMVTRCPGFRPTPDKGADDE